MQDGILTAGPTVPAASNLPDLLQQRGIDLEALVDVLLDAPRIAYVLAAVDGSVLFANLAAQRSLGAAPGRALAESIPEIVPEVERAIAEERPAGGLAFRRGEAIYRPRVAPVPGASGLAGVLCVFVDSTGSETMAEQLRANEELAREQDAIIDSMTDGLWVCDGDANVLRINRASERLNEIEARQVVGRNMRDLVAEGIFDRSATLEVLRTGAPVNMLQARRGRQLALTGVPVTDARGRIIRVVVNERDITEVETLHRELAEQEAMKDRYRHQMLERQIEEIESRRVIAKSASMQRAVRQAIKVAGVDSTVLILGESGVGKGLFADLIHKYSSRAGRPLVKVNCGAIPESLVEAELFGYEKGAFTGAQPKGKPGYFELADGGILFLDEIAELPLSSQVKLLRFLEDCRITRVGGTQSRRLDVRILAATHGQLQQMVDRGTFRLDLFYRLNVIPLAIPALRDRPECILPLLRSYLDLFGARVGVRRRLTRAASELLHAYAWPGNVRELMNLCERLVVMTDGESIDVAELPADLTPRPAPPPAPGDRLLDGSTLDESVERVERALLERARERFGSQTAMAEALGVNQSTIARKMKKYRL